MSGALAEQIVKMYRDEGESSRRIVRILRARGMQINENIVNDALREAGLSNARYIGKRKIEIPGLEKLAARWNGGSGESLTALAKEAGVAGETLGRRFVEAGYAREISSRVRPGTPIEDLEYAAELYRQGRTLRAIADEFGVDQGRLSSQLKDAGYIPDEDLRLLRGPRRHGARGKSARAERLR